MFVTPCRVGDLINRNGQPYAWPWNSTKSGRCMLNVCVFNAAQCVCTCGSSTHCVCVSVCVFVCLYVCVSVCLCVCVCYHCSGCYRSFQIQCKVIPPNLP